VCYDASVNGRRLPRRVDGEPVEAHRACIIAANETKVHQHARATIAFASERILQVLDAGR
jgi:hypothetical protein